LKIRKVITDVFPTHSFYGEETGQFKKDNAWTWVVDPIDGTAGYITGKPTFGTLIALCYEGVPLLGIIDHAALDDRWIGVKGRQTTHNGKPVLSNVDITKLENSTLYSAKYERYKANSVQYFLALSRQCKINICTEDCLAFGLLASGFTELVLESNLEVFDYMALVPVVEGSGGVISDWRGVSITLNTSGDILASANSQLHSAALELMLN